ncbi:MAG: ATP-grasp domain-containing protein [Pricia sp.]|nr:ATP-grasp domain-containing protein [Pricia sp.]
MENSDTSISVLIPDGEHYYFRTIANCLSEANNLKIYLFSNKKDLPMRYSRFIDHFSYYPKTSDVKEWIAQINSETERHDIDLILPVFEDSMRALLENKNLLTNAKKLMLLPTLENYKIALNKGLFAQHLYAQNIPQPKTAHTKNGQLANDAVLEIGFPMLVKPGLNSGGGMGIKILKNQEALDGFLTTQKNVDSYVFQEFIEGEDVGCNVLCKNGEILAYTIQKGFLWSSRPYTPQVGLNFIFKEDVYAIVSKLMKSLNWSGVANIDFLFDKKNNCFKVLEINPRYWATMEASLIAGVNFPYLYCLMSLGKSFEQPTYRHISYLSVQGVIISVRKDIGLLARPRYLLKNTPLRFAFRDSIAHLYHYSWAIKKTLFSRKQRK